MLFGQTVKIFPTVIKRCLPGYKNFVLKEHPSLEVPLFHVFASILHHNANALKPIFLTGNIFIFDKYRSNLQKNIYNVGSFNVNIHIHYNREKIAMTFNE